jgi:hypothetical protein
MARSIDLAGCPTLRGFRRVGIEAADLEPQGTILRAEADDFIVNGLRAPEGPLLHFGFD